MIDAVILAGGKGTRLSSVVPDVPKPLAYVGSGPFLGHLTAYLKGCKQIGRVVVSAGYKAELIEKWAKAAKQDVVIAIEPEPLGTGGGLLHALQQVSTDMVLVLNGDSLIRLDLDEMITSHRKSGCKVTVAVTPVENVSQSGEVIITGDKITEFREKGGKAHAGWINAGIYLFDTAMLKSLPEKACSLEKDLMPDFMKSGIHAFMAHGAFVDIGTPENYAKAAGILGVV